VKNERLGFFDYVMAFLMILLMFMAASCTPDDEVLIQVSPTLEIDGNLPMDLNGYYHLELNQDTNQTIHTVSGTVGYTEYWDEPLKVSWDSNLTWIYQGEDVSTSNQSSYVVDGNVYNVIAPINTMIGDTLILTGTIREHLVSDTINIVLD
jgi:hypothetical protein